MPPHVSVIVPARNEAAGIVACIGSILAQEVPGGVEVIVADGRSTDDTADLARSAGAIVVDNPRRTTPAGLNAALAAARGDVIMRFDGHAEMSRGYIGACLRALEEEPGAVNVGGWCRIEGRGPWGRAVAAALGSRFGTGNPRLHRPPAPGSVRTDVDAFPFGCWHAEELRRHGGWDERFLRNQDFELSYRMRRTGGRLVFDPSIWAVYHPRESLRAVARQYWDYGRFKALAFVAVPGSVRPRQLAPFALLATAVAAFAPGGVGRPARAAMGVYAAILAVVTARSRAGWRTLPVLLAIHFAWGGGLVLGLSRIGLGRLRGRPRLDV